MPLTLPPSARLWLSLLLVPSTSVWLGGYVAVAVMASSSRAALTADARVTFFRQFGRAYLPVGAGALALALASGGMLLAQRRPDGLTALTVTAALLLVLLLAVGVGQARCQTQLRRRAQQAPADSGLTDSVRRGGRAATLLRAALGLLSLLLVVLGCVLATG